MIWLFMADLGMLLPEGAVPGASGRWGGGGGLTAFGTDIDSYRRVL